MQKLLDLLIKIIEHSDANKMTLSNVAMIMAPNIFLAPKLRVTPGREHEAMETEIKLASVTSKLMRMMIRYKHILWTVGTCYT